MRVVLHAHSTWSYDGRWSLGAIARLYGRLGVGAVMMTEHDTGFDPARFDEFREACRAASTPRCRLVPGIEYSCPDNVVHVLTWGLPRFLGEGRPTAETLGRVRDEGGVAVLAHPTRRDAWRCYEDEWTGLLAGIELWNRKTDGLSPSEEAGALLRRTGLPATVGQDFHDWPQLYPLSHRVAAQPAKAGEPALEARLVAALAEGATRPEAFGRPLLSPDGDRRDGPHRRLDDLRRRLRGRRPKARNPAA